VGRPFEYIFFVDFEGHIYEGRINEPVKVLKDRSTGIKFLGSYPKSPDFGKVQIGIRRQLEVSFSTDLQFLEEIWKRRLEG
jgi:hypothetical protein